MHVLSGLLFFTLTYKLTKYLVLKLIASRVKNTLYRLYTYFISLYPVSFCNLSLYEPKKCGCHEQIVLDFLDRMNKTEEGKLLNFCSYLINLLISPIVPIKHNCCKQFVTDRSFNSTEKVFHRGRAKASSWDHSEIRLIGYSFVSQFPRESG